MIHPGRIIRGLFLGTFFAIMVAPAGGQEQRQPLAMIICLKGVARITSGNKQRDCSHFDLMIRGDRLATDKDAEVSLVFLATGERFRLNGADELIIDESDVPARSKAVRQPVPQDGKPGIVKGLKALRKTELAGAMIFRSPQGCETPSATVPICGAAVMQDRPSFEWPDVGDKAALFVLYDSTKKRICSFSAPARGMTWPEEQPRLQAGRSFHWEIIEQNAPQTVLVRSSFSVLLPEEAQEAKELQPLLDSEELADRLLASAMLEQYQLYDLRLALTEQLNEKYARLPIVADSLAEQRKRAGKAAAKK